MSLVKFFLLAFVTMVSFSFLNVFLTVGGLGYLACAVAGFLYVLGSIIVEKRS